MLYGFETATDISTAAHWVKRRRYGIIRVEDGHFHSIRFRPWPKIISRLEILTWGRWRHQSTTGDQCSLHYNLPLVAPGFLTVAYVQSTSQTSWQSVRRCLELVDWIAKQRRLAASVCELSNQRISDRVMRRLLWEPHCEHLSGRHFIRRYYGSYPCHAWLDALDLDPVASLETTPIPAGVSYG